MGGWPDDAGRSDPFGRGTGKSLSETLVARRTIGAEDLASVAHARLLDEACEIVSAEGGAFTFTEGTVPRGVFDPEERRLRLRLPSSGLLMEAARRQDHWRLIRERVPSDTAHFVVQHVPRPPQDPDHSRRHAAQGRADLAR